MSRFQVGVRTDTALANVRVRQDQCRQLTVECPRCRRGMQVSVMPWSPQVAKVHCIPCDEPFEVQTRESQFDAIEAHVARHDDREATGKKTSVNVQKDERLQFELRAIREKRLKSMPRVKTPWGNAVLIG